MSDPRPELIFLSGPQKDRRAVIMKDVVVAGRSPSADIVFAEEHASRKQIQFILTTDGWTVENISTNPIRINGKKYKAGKQVLLETGDVLRVGLESEMLFVDGGDDPDIALSAWRDTHAASPEPEVPEPEEEPPTAELPPEPAAEETPKSKPEKPEKVKKAEDPAAAERKAKIRKYAIGGGIYLALMIVLVIMLAFLKKEKPHGPDGAPKRLTDEQIEEAMDYDITGVPESLVAAEEAMDKAVNYYRTRYDAIGNLYLCVKSFKLYLACSESHGFKRTSQEEMYRTAGAELLERVTDCYGKAYIKERNKLYDEARDLFKTIRQMLPEDMKQGNPVFDVIISNVNKHIEYCRKQGKLKD